MRNGKADEWARAYVERIQQHLDAKETSFSTDADNATFPPSISGIQSAIVAYATNQREWGTANGGVTLTATSNVTTVSSYQWSARFDFEAEYPEAPITPAVPECTLEDGTYLLCSPDGSLALAASGRAVRAAAAGCAFAFTRDAETELYTIRDGASGLKLGAASLKPGAQVGLGAGGEEPWAVTLNVDRSFRLSPASDCSLSIDVHGG